ncbi:MAG: L,D-transpeptidase family protein [Maricaulaceae bacterium]|nr:L,D-transpeptidase family protein [Maricaulaceae bacterium]
MDWTVTAAGVFSLNGRSVRAALGRAGVIAAEAKREGDGATPLGVFALRRVLYRADRGPAPGTMLPTRAIRPDDGWCDAPADPAYNLSVRLPWPASCETMTRADGLYDLVVVLDHNAAPPVQGLGSAIFLHCAAPDYAPTQGCVALAKPDLLELLRAAAPGDRLNIIR